MARDVNDCPRSCHTGLHAFPGLAKESEMHRSLMALRTCTAEAVRHSVCPLSNLNLRTVKFVCRSMERTLTGMFTIPHFRPTTGRWVFLWPHELGLSYLDIENTTKAAATTRQWSEVAQGCDNDPRVLDGSRTTNCKIHVCICRAFE